MGNMKPVFETVKAAREAFDAGRKEEAWELLNIHYDTIVNATTEWAIQLNGTSVPTNERARQDLQRLWDMICCLGEENDAEEEAALKDFNKKVQPNWDYDNICGQCERMNPNAEPPPPANVYHQELYYDCVRLRAYCSCPEER